MGAALGGGAGGGGGGSRRRRRRKAPMADINMTPFIDVMLCLLIIFMVAAPLLTAGVPLDLPKSDAGALNQDKDPLTVSVKKNGDIFVQETKVAVEDVVPKLKAISQAGFDERVFVRGDTVANWGAMARVMGNMSEAGFHKLAIVTQPDDN